MATTKVRDDNMKLNEADINEYNKGFIAGYRMAVREMKSFTMCNLMRWIEKRDVYKNNGRKDD